MGIVQRGAPGGVNVNIYSLTTIVNGNVYDTQNPETGDTLSVPANKSYTLRMAVENNGGTGFLSPDNCNGGQGTLLQAELRVPRPDTVAGYPVGPNCHNDKGFFSGDPPNVLYEETGLQPLSPGRNGRITFWVKGAETGDRMTPVYFLDLNVVAEDDDDGGGGGGGDEPFETYRVDVTDCDVPDQIEAGELFRVNYRVENTNDQPAKVTVDIIADGGANFGTVVLEQATFDLPANYYQNRYYDLPAPTFEGDLDITVAVSNASQQ